MKFVQEHANDRLCFFSLSALPQQHRNPQGVVGSEPVQPDMQRGWKQIWCQATVSVEIGEANEDTGSLCWFTDGLTGVLALFLGETASLNVCL